MLQGKKKVRIFIITPKYKKKGSNVLTYQFLFTGHWLPLLASATVLMYEGFPIHPRPTWPNAITPPQLVFLPVSHPTCLSVSIDSPSQFDDVFLSCFAIVEI